MRKLFRLLIVLFILYIFLEAVFNYFSKGYKSIYKLDGFSVTETRVKRTKNEMDNYYFEIKKDDTVFSIQTNKSISTSQNVLGSIKYFKNDEYECIFPLTKNDEAISDIICKVGSIYYYYNSLEGHDNDLDRFSEKLSKYRKDFNNSSKVIHNKDNVTVYDNLGDITIGLEHYKGMYLISSNDFINNDLFTHDIYTREISAFTSDYYIVADYKEIFDFHNFYVIDLKTHKMSKITSNNKISMYSYIEGVIDNLVYLFDPSNKVQYEIDIKNNSIKEIGNESLGINIYNDGKWSKINIYDAINNKVTFESIKTEFNNKTYDKVDHVGNKLSGYYYLYLKNKEKYDVYRVNVQNNDNIVYLFSTDTISDVLYKNDTVIFKDKNYLKYYSDLTGVKVLLQNNEVNFNKTLKFGFIR